MKVIAKLDRKIDDLRKRVKGVEDIRVGSEVFDKAALLTLYKLASDGVIDTLHGVIKTGKEANVFFAKDREGLPLAVKIHRVTTGDYKSMLKYIHGDHRFKKIKKNKRAIVYTWVEKEFKNLKIAEEVGARVPKPIASRNNVLVMEFIGKGEEASPMLKNCELEDPRKVFNLIIKYIEILYRKGNLIHGDLSEYNVLMLNETPVLIDLSQGVIKGHPLTQELLLQDIRNISRYFKRYFKIDEEKIFARITGSKIVRE